MAHEFRIGDRVRVVDRRPSDAFELCWSSKMDATLGKEGVVTNFHPDGILRVEFHDDWWHYKPSWLILVESTAKSEAPNPPFKPGDRVRVKSLDELKEYPKDCNGDPIVGDLTLQFLGMTGACGKVFTVSNVTSSGDFGLEGTPFVFSPGMLEPVESEALSKRPSSAAFAIQTLERSLRDLLGCSPSSKADTAKLPLINSTKLLTSIKLD